jgi:hypothetical protein
MIAGHQERQPSRHLPPGRARWTGKLPTFYAGDRTVANSIRPQDESRESECDRQQRARFRALQVSRHEARDARRRVRARLATDPITGFGRQLLAIGLTPSAATVTMLPLCSTTSGARGMWAIPLVKAISCPGPDLRSALVAK